MFERVVGILKEHCESGCEITMDSALLDDLGLSSLDILNLVAEFEDEFDIDIPDRVIPSIHTVEDIVRYLEKNAK